MIWNKAELVDAYKGGLEYEKKGYEAAKNLKEDLKVLGKPIDLIAQLLRQSGWL